MSEQQTTTVKLSTPIIQGEQVINELTLRMPTAGDLRGCKLMDFLQTDVETLERVLPRVTTNVVLTPDAIKKLNFVQLTEIQTGIADFFPLA